MVVIEGWPFWGCNMTPVFGKNEPLWKKVSLSHTAHTNIASLFLTLVQSKVNDIEHTKSDDTAIRYICSKYFY